MMKVLCISIRETYPEQIKVDELYYIDRESIFIDIDGDAYGMVYKDEAQKELVGSSLLLRHFRSAW